MYTNTQTVLVVEDAPMIRAVCVRTLAAQGFEVLEASYAEEALRVWSRHRDRIDIVVSDVCMPGRSGHALVSELQADKPDLKVVLMSAVPLQVLAEDGMDCDGFQFLRKPFHPPHLIEAVVSAAG